MILNAMVRASAASACLHISCSAKRKFNCVICESDLCRVRQLARVDGENCSWIPGDKRQVRPHHASQACTCICYVSVQALFKMVAHAKVTAAFRRLIALVARCFYAGECPPKTEEELAAPVTAKSKLQVDRQDTELPLNLNKSVSPGNPLGHI